MDPTLDEVFRYELAKRSTNDGIAIAALGGDREAIAAFAGLAVVSAESATVYPEVRDWLVGVLAKIHAGLDPNEAFGWKKKRAGAPGLRESFDRLSRAWLIAQHVAGLRANKPGASFEEIFAEVAVARSVSAATVRDYWGMWTGARPVTNSRE